MKHTNPLSAILFLSMMLITPLLWRWSGGEAFAQSNRLWATYYGGASDEDQINDIATDAFGNVYIAGHTGSTSDIASSGGFQSAFGGGTYDAFLVKFSPAGDRLWATYYGGTGDDAYYYTGVATDALGNVYLAGATGSSSGIASSGGFQTAHGGDVSDLFLVKFNAAGTRIWATYYGGSARDENCSVATDTDGNVYLAGITYGSPGIASGGFQTTFGGASDFFIVKFNSDGTPLWSTYYGGTGDEYSFSEALATDISGNVYLAGRTNDSGGMASTGGFKITTNGGGGGSGAHEVFLVKFSPAGDRLWATYYGGTGDYGYGVATDVSENVYLAGTARSSTGIASGGFQNTKSVGIDAAFLVKFAPAGTRLWATYYGGITDSEIGKSVATDASGNVYLGGDALSTNGIASGGFQNSFISAWTYGVASNQFVAEFDAAGNRICATYYGQDFEQYGHIAVDGLGDVYLTGQTVSPNGIASAGGFQTAIGSLFDAYLVKFSSCLSANVSITNINCSGSCTGTTTVTASGGISPHTYLWNTTPAQTTQALTALCEGTYTLTIKDAVDSTTITAVNIIALNPLPTVLVSENVSLCVGQNISLSSGGAINFAWSPSTGLSATTGDIILADPPIGLNSYTVIGTDGNGCSNSAITTITMYDPILLVSPNVSVCSGVQTALTSAGVDSYTWLPSTGLSATTGSYVLAKPPAGIVTYTVTGTYTVITGCTRTAAVSLTINALPTVNAGTDQYICPNDSASISAIGASGNYTWSPGIYFVSNTGATVKAGFPEVADTYTCSVLLLDINNCSASDTVLINVVTALIANAGQDISMVCGTTTTLTGSGGLTFAWSPATGLNPSNSSMPVFDPTAVGMLPGTYTYSLVVASGLGCVSAPDEITITLANITANAGTDQSICAGTTANLIATGGQTYTWTPDTGLGNTNSNTTDFSSIEAGTYSYVLNASAGTGCESTDSVSITVIVIPTVYAGENVTVRFNKGDTLHATGNAQSYSWNPTLCNDCLSPFVNPQQTTDYIITASNAFCTQTDTATAIFVPYPCEIYVPNAFSPNGDGQNDSIKVYSYCIIPEGFAFRIFDRWGTMVFQSYNQNESWNGNYLNEPLVSNIFVYTINGTTINNDAVNEKGNVTLVR